MTCDCRVLKNPINFSHAENIIRTLDGGGEGWAVLSISRLGIDGSLGGAATCPQHHLIRGGGQENQTGIVNITSRKSTYRGPSRDQSYYIQPSLSDKQPITGQTTDPCYVFPQWSEIRVWNMLQNHKEHRYLLSSTTVCSSPRTKEGGNKLACGWGGGVGSRFGRLE